MVSQLLEACIQTIAGKEECLGIGNVNRDRHAQRSACFPHCIETWIVDFNQWPLRDSLTQIETQYLQNFESARACLVCANNLVGLKFAVRWLIRALPPRLREDYEPFRIGPLKLSNRFL